MHLFTKFIASISHSLRLTLLLWGYSFQYNLEIYNQVQPAIDSIEPIIFIGALLVLISIVVSRVSARLGVPALLLFLILGMIAGSEGPGGIDFDDPEIARSIGVVPLALILLLVA